MDVIIVGAGLSGIGAACHLKRECPRKSFVILEAREAMGGTWDLFRYPGVRSDSDMYTLGYRFRPWRDSKAMADGPAILNYIRATAAEYERRQNDSLQPSRAARLLVVGPGALDRRRRNRTIRPWSSSHATSSISAPGTTTTKVGTRQSGPVSHSSAE